jgi:hypothetical protein
MFTLVARDPLAPALVEQWADHAERNGEAPEKVSEARQLAQRMRVWRAAHTA